MNPQESRQFTELVRRLRDERGLTVLLIEHDMKVVMGVSERVTVLDYGDEDRRGPARRDPARPARHRGLPRQGRPSRAARRRRRERAGSRARHGPRGRRARGAGGQRPPRLLRQHRRASRASRSPCTPGEIVSLIGSNGAGKSTTLRTISGLLRAEAGHDHASRARRSSGRPGHEIVRLGIAQSPEGRKIFGRMTVRENLELGAFQRNDRDGIESDMERVFDLFPRLRERQQQRAGTHVRRRAADARHRPRADGPPAPAAARRAVAGPGARCSST